MSIAQPDSFEELQSRIQQLIGIYEKQKAENELLSRQKSDMQEQVRLEQERVKDLEEKYNKLKDRLEGTLPLRMTATPEIIAETIRYFIEDAVLVTGEALLLDGGHHLI